MQCNTNYTGSDENFRYINLNVLKTYKKKFPNILLGFILGSSVIILYFLRLVKPEIARDEDIFFATIGLLYSGILVIHGWRLDPILLFSQVLVITAVLAAGWENIRLRGILAMLALRDIKKDKKIN